MTLFLLGIDYRVAPVDVREAAYWQRERINEFLSGLGLVRASILSTCNRFEIYGVADSESDAYTVVGAAKGGFNTIFRNGYALYGDKNVFEHLKRLASGILSQVKGEREILEQLDAWASRGDLPGEIARRVHDALLAATGARKESGLTADERNIAVSVYDELLSANGSDNLTEIVIAGTGRIAELFALYRPQGVRLHFAAHKNIAKARVLAGLSDGAVLTLKELPGALLKVDALVSATSSPHRVFNKNYFLKVAASRDRELRIYDLAFPRDVSPCVSEIGGILLKNIDEVFTDENIKVRYAPQQASR